MESLDLQAAHAIKLNWIRHQAEYRALCASRNQRTDPRAFNTYLSHCIKVAFEL